MWKFHRRINKMENKEESLWKKPENLNFEQTIEDFRKITGVENEK